MLAEADDRDRDDEAGGQDHELDARERGEARKGDEGELRPLGRAVEGCGRRGDGRENERERERVGEDPARIEHVRDGDREGAQRNRDPGGEAEPAREPEDRDGAERHDDRVDQLNRPERRCDVVEEPGRGGQQWLKEGGEVGRAAADERAAVLCDGAADLRVDVLVGKVDRRGTEPAGERASDRARGDHGDEGLTGVTRAHASEAPGWGEVGTSVRSHDPSIGLRRGG